jgi:hypothetical protein
MKDGISPNLARFMDRLSPEERDELVGVLRDSETFIAEDFNDVIAILRQISA